MWIKRTILLIVGILGLSYGANAQTILSKQVTTETTLNGERIITTTSYTSSPKPKAKWDDVLLKERNLEDLLSEVKKDSTLQIERLAAFYFYQLINEYRIKNKKGWLLWDDRLWLAARNHNLYIAHNNFAHDEIEKHPFYTGNDPGDRVNYVKDNQSTISWSGENIYCRSNFNGKTIEEAAKDIALDAFEGWKHSPGHNENMLNEKSKFSGTSFYITRDSGVVATSVFANWCSNSESKNNFSIFWDNELAARNIPNFVVREGKLFSSISEEELNATVMNMIEARMPKDKSTIDKGMILAASKHLLYLKTNKSRTTIQSKKGDNFYETTTVKRYMKAINRCDKWYSLRKKPKVAEKCFVISIEFTDFLDKTVFSKIEKKIAYAFPLGSNVKKWGAVVDFSKMKDQYQCIIDVVWAVK